MSYQPKIALVHDDFIQRGGAESLFVTIANLFPKAPIYTSLVDWQKLPSSISKDRIRSSWLQKIPLTTKFYKTLLPLYPLAFESFNFDEFDLIISSTTRFAKSVVTSSNCLHICYLNSLPRFLWSLQAQTEYLPSLLFTILKPYFSWLVRWDIVAASRVDVFVANSQNVASQIEAIYKQKAHVIYPFADLDFFKPARRNNWALKSQNYFLIVTRLVKWKRVEIAIEAASHKKFHLKIVGSGPDLNRLKKLAQNLNVKVEFIGRVTSKELLAIYRNCQALITTQEEDFGIAQLEAQAVGKPVIAYLRGGASEIIIEGKTGLFFKKQDHQSLEDAIDKFSRVKWEISVIRKNAQRFSRPNFIKEFKKVLMQYAPKTN